MGTINTHSAPITPQQARPAAQQAPVQQQAPQGQHQTQVGDASQVRSHTTAALNSEPAHHGSDPHAAKETVHRQGEAASHITGGESHGTDKSYGDGHDAGYKKKKTWQYKTVHNAHVAHATADAAELAGVVADGATKAQGGLGTRLNAGLDELAHHNRVGGHHGHGDHGASAADEVANAANSSSGADDVAHAVGGADEAANAANSASGADEIAHGLAGADEAAAVAKGAPKTPTTALKSIENSNLSSDTKDMYQAIRDQATKSTGGADDAAKAVGGADEAATAAKAAGSADEAATAAKAAGSVDEVAHAAGKLSVLGKVAKGAGVLGAVVGTVAGPLQISEGIKEGGASGAAHVVGGVALTGSGVAGLAAVAPGIVGAGAAAAAAPLAVGLGGAAAAIDGGRQVAKNWDDRGADNKVGAGMLKTGGGTAMMVGAGLMATGVGAPIGAALVVGGAAVTAVTYLAENTKVGKAVTKAVGGAAHAVADTAVAVAGAVGDGISSAASAVGDGISSAASAVGDGISSAASAVGDAASSTWSALTSWW